MSRVDLPHRLDVPESLQEQLLEFRRRVWATKLVEATAIAVAGVLAAYLVVFAIDRLWDTPASLRTAIAATAVAVCAIVPLFLHRWVWRRRQLEQLARLLSHKMPHVGDQLLGIIELAHSDAEQARSRALCQAAIEQVAADAQSRDLCAALPPSRHRMWTIGALAAAAVVIALAALFPAAASNAWSRFAAPWRDTPRYTFAAIEPLGAEVVVAHGEPFSLTVRLQENSQWRPANARLQIGEQPPIAATLSGDRYEFAAAGLINPADAHIKVGDAAQTVRIEPKTRPELTAADASVKLPEYLGRPAPLRKDVRGGAVSLVKGSSAEFAATASRKLAAAKVDGQPRQPKGAKVTTDSMAVADSRDLKLSWRDEFGLECKEPFTIAITADDDEAPNVTLEDMPRRKIMLDSEQLKFKVTARDDFGVREVGMQWKGVGEDMVDKPAQGEQLLSAGGHEHSQLDLAGTFTATSLGIEPQPIELRIFVNDYYPDRQRVYSPPYLLYVLSAEQHAIWITEQMSKWHRQSLEVRDREMRLYEVNKQLRALSAEELDQPDARRQVENQAAAEKANARRLSALSTSGEELLRQAARNPEIGVGHLDRWAEMLEILQDISANRMPSVADLLKAGSQAKSLANKTPSSNNKMAGQARDSGAAPGGSEAPKDAKAPPAAPQLVDVESSQQPDNPNAKAGEPTKKNPTAPSLRLPSTTLIGQAKDAPPPSPAGEKVDQAVEEQKDLLAEFDKVANEMNAILANLEGSTLVKRLKAASRRQYRIAGSITAQIEKTFGQSKAGLEKEVQESFANLSSEEDDSSFQVSTIMDDMEAYFERRRLVRFKTILDEMRKEDVIGNLRRLAEDIPIERGMSIAQAEYWSDVMDRWAEDLVDPACSGECPGCRSKGSLPPSIVLEVLKILEGEINLREETRVAEQAKAGVKPEKHSIEATRLSGVQRTLDDRIIKVIDRILELPDAEQEFGKELQLLDQVSVVMADAGTILESPETGSPAIAAETEAIELLLQSRRINPKGGGGGGGANPGGGGGGDTKDSALALLGPGLNQKEVREDRGTQQAVGETGKTLPEEFRAGLDEYFNQLESDPDAG